MFSPDSPHIHKAPWNPLTPSFVRSFDGWRIGLHRMVKAVFSGVKTTFVLTLANGNSLRLTSNHEVLTHRGFIPLDALLLSDEVMVDSAFTPPGYSRAVSIERFGDEETFDIICDDPHHNFVANGIVIHNSGKTACEVREMMMNRNLRRTFTNIQTKLDNQVTLTPDMIIKRDAIGQKRDGTPVFDYTLNVDFWKGLNEPINVVLDEAHSILNSRRSMSKTNIIMTDWLALVRRVLGGTDSGYGELVFITQLPNRLDSIARDMATQVRYHVCHYKKSCRECGATWSESSEVAEQLWQCPACRSNSLHKHSFVIEVWHFPTMPDFQAWKAFGVQSFYKHYLINDIEEVFPLYDTLQWDNLFGEFY